MREVCPDDVGNSFEKLGGRGTIVEIDEAKIGQSKYNRGRYLPPFFKKEIFLYTPNHNNTKHTWILIKPLFVDQS